MRNDHKAKKEKKNKGKSLESLSRKTPIYSIGVLRSMSFILKLTLRKINSSPHLLCRKNNKSKAAKF